MSIEVINGIFALGGLLVGGIITWLLQKDRLIKEHTVAIEAIKTDYMAEKTALYYLNHKGYTDRSFELLSKRLGGFEDNELRKILVRCGAVRYRRDDGTEWWRLLSRSEEVVKKRKEERENLGVDNKDL